MTILESKQYHKVQETPDRSEKLWRDLNMVSLLKDSQSFEQLIKHCSVHHSDIEKYGATENLPRNGLPPKRTGLTKRAVKLKKMQQRGPS